MSAKDLQRIEVLTEFLAGRRTVNSAATVLAISDRQVNRLMVRYRDGGGGALIHQARGRASNNHLDAGVREYALELVRRNYRDFGPTLATEALQERHGIRVGRETVRKWMVADGLWLSRKQRRTFHQPRLRRESYGELVQIDGSEHRWFENRADPCTLLVFIDDATSKRMERYSRSTLPHRPWKPLQNSGSHITHRKEDDGSILSLLLGRSRDSSTWFQHGRSGSVSSSS